VERLKALKLEYVSRLAGKPVLAPHIARNRDGLPAGVWSWLFKLPTKKGNAFKVLNTLLVYTTLKAPEITKKQKEKFFGSMESEDKTGLKSTFKFVPKVRVPRVEQPKPFLLGCTSSRKSAPSALGPSIRQDDAFGQLVYFTQSVPSGIAWNRYPLVFGKVVPKPLTKVMIGKPGCYIDFPQELRPCQAIGKIGFIQEPGFKLRAVANPNAVWQMALEPLKRLILADLKLNFPTDCTHDQMEGVQCIQGWLKEGRTCFSVDLSDATNLMPRHLQMDVLRRRYDCIRLTDQEYLTQLVDAFEYASASPWYFRSEEDGQWKLASFKRGQPLGLGPSFASFALAHNLLLLGLCKAEKVNPNDTFRILGDDIVISHYGVHRRYRAALDNLGCKVSESKTLVSDVCAEFAGKVITPTEVISTYKWRDIDGSNFLDIAMNLGRESRRLLGKEQRKIIDVLAPIPKELGGLGWNPEGKALAERLGTPTANWLLERALTSDKHQVLVRYETLTSLYKRFQNQIIQSGYIPTYNTDSIEQRLWADMPFSTREGVLEYWDNSYIKESVTTAAAQSRQGLPVFDLVFSRVGEFEDLFRTVWHDQHGWLVPSGIDKPGDPRKQKQFWMLGLLQYVTALNGKSVSSRAFARATSVLTANALNRSPRPFYTELKVIPLRVSQELDSDLLQQGIRDSEVTKPRLKI
jgi:hypothetical protein